MKCEKCGYENPESNKFCGDCGAKIVIPKVKTILPKEIIHELPTAQSYFETEPKPPQPNQKELVETKTKHSKRNYYFFGIIILLILLGPFLNNLNTYFAAENYFKQNKFKDSTYYYTNLGNFFDSEVKAKESKYQWAKKYLEIKDYQRAITLLKPLEQYKDSQNLLNLATYYLAVDFLKAKNYEEAIPMFSSLGSFNKSDNLLIGAKYSFAEQLMAQGKYSQVLELLLSLGNFKESINMIMEANYQIGLNSIKTNELKTADEIFTNLPGYKDSDELRRKIEYKLGEENFNNGELLLAKVYFHNSESYSSSQKYIEGINRLLDLQGFWDCSPLNGYGNLRSLYIHGIELELGKHNGSEWFSSDSNPHTKIGLNEAVNNSILIPGYFLMNPNSQAMLSLETTYWAIVKDEKNIGPSTLNNNVDKCDKNNDVKLHEYIAHPVVIKVAPYIGMTAEEAKRSTWGSPSDINRTTTAYGTDEQWVYNRMNEMQFLYFENGILTAIQE